MIRAPADRAMRTASGMCAVVDQHQRRPDSRAVAAMPASAPRSSMPSTTAERDSEPDRGAVELRSEHCVHHARQQCRDDGTPPAQAGGRRRPGCMRAAEPSARPGRRPRTGPASTPANRHRAPGRWAAPEAGQTEHQGHAAGRGHEGDCRSRGPAATFSDKRNTRPARQARRRSVPSATTGFLGTSPPSHRAAARAHRQHAPGRSRSAREHRR